MIVYKVVQVEDGCYYSALKGWLPPDWVECYYTEKFTMPFHTRSFYYAFKTLIRAKDFCLEYRRNLPNIEIWEADGCVSSSIPKVRRTLAIGRLVLLDWWDRLTRRRKIEWDYPPIGTVWCSRIKLLRCVERCSVCT